MLLKSPYTESDYALLFAGGDEQGLAYFFDVFYPALCLFSNHFIKNREAAEEIASQAFIDTWRNNAKLKTPGAIRAYLYTVVRHESIAFAKRENKKLKLRNSIATVPVVEKTIFDNLVNAELSRYLFNTLHKLPPGSSLVLQMHFMEGKTLNQIATELHVSESTVKTQKQRGLMALRKKLIRPLFIFFTFL